MTRAKYNEGQKRVYWNLHKKVYSVQTYIKGRGWIVTDHCESLVINNASGKVSQAVRAKVVEEKRKQVHAWLHGDICLDATVSDVSNSEKVVIYNPYKYNQFYVLDTETSTLTALNDCDDVTINCVIHNGRPVMYVGE